jgi:hypothetical protein
MLNFFDNIIKKNDEDDDVKEYYIPPGQSAQEKEDWAPFMWGIVGLCVFLSLCSLVLYFNWERFMVLIGKSNEIQTIDVNGQAVLPASAHAPGQGHGNGKAVGYGQAG